MGPISIKSRGTCQPLGRDHPATKISNLYAATQLLTSLGMKPSPSEDVLAGRLQRTKDCFLGKRNPIFQGQLVRSMEGKHVGHRVTKKMGMNCLCLRRYQARHESG